MIESQIRYYKWTAHVRIGLLSDWTNLFDPSPPVRTRIMYLSYNNRSSYYHSIFYRALWLSIVGDVLMSAGAGQTIVPAFSDISNVVL